MKKHITVEQLREITNEKLIPGLDSRPFNPDEINRMQRCKTDFNLGSIIVFLESQEKRYRIREMNRIQEIKRDEGWTVELDGEYFVGVELCDALFEAMKYVVEKLRKKPSNSEGF